MEFTKSPGSDCSPVFFLALSVLVHGSLIYFLPGFLPKRDVNTRRNEIVLKVFLKPPSDNSAPEYKKPTHESSPNDKFDAYNAMQAYLESEEFEAFMSEELGGGMRMESDAERDIELLKKYNVLTMPGLAMVGSRTAKLRLANGRSVCFDIGEPDPFDQFGINMAAFTSC